MEEEESMKEEESVEQSALPSGRIRTRLKAVRQQASMSTESMAQRLGVPKRVYVSWEYGERHPKLDALYQFAQTLEVDPAWLAGFSEVPAAMHSNPSQAMSPATKSHVDAKGTCRHQQPAADWVGLPAETLLEWVRLEDDSLAPNVLKGAWLWVEQRPSFAEVGYYALLLSNKVTVRHISEAVTGGYLISSPNPLIGRVEVSHLDILSLLGPVRGCLSVLHA